MKVVIDSSIPVLVRTSQQLFRQVILNLLEGTFASASNSSTITLNARFAGDKIIIEILSSCNMMTKSQQEEVEKMCREEELSIILESSLIDTNTKIAFMIARQIGWPVDF